MKLPVRNPLDKILFEALDPKGWAALVLRFGLDGKAPRTFDDIGRRIGCITREAARRQVNNAIRKLRGKAFAPRLETLLLCCDIPGFWNACDYAETPHKFAKNKRVLVPPEKKYPVKPDPPIPDAIRTIDIYGYRFNQIEIKLPPVEVVAPINKFGKNWMDHTTGKGKYRYYKEGHTRQVLIPHHVLYRVIEKIRDSGYLRVGSRSSFFYHPASKKLICIASHRYGYDPKVWVNCILPAEQWANHSPS